MIIKEVLTEQFGLGYSFDLLDTPMGDLPIWGHKVRVTDSSTGSFLETSVSTLTDPALIGITESIKWELGPRQMELAL